MRNIRIDVLLGYSKILVWICIAIGRLAASESKLFFPGESFDFSGTTPHSSEYYFQKGVAHFFGNPDHSSSKVDLTRAFVYLTIAKHMGDLNATFYLQVMRSFKLGETQFFSKFSNHRQILQVRAQKRQPEHHSMERQFSLFTRHRRPLSVQFPPGTVSVPAEIQVPGHDSVFLQGPRHDLEKRG